VTLRESPRDARATAAANEGARATLFGDVLALFDEQRLDVRDGRSASGPVVPVDDLPLSDFHFLRALAIRAGLAPEDEVRFACRNCDAPLVVRPCAALEPGPWVDGELGDDELDATLPFGEPHDIPEVPLGRVRGARTVTFARRTVRDARPLWRALAGGTLAIDEAFVGDLGVVALGPEQDPARIADALSACSDDAFAAIADVFVASHYPPRLAAATFCDACGARSDVDAPFARELLPDAAPEREADRRAREGAARGFPAFDAFAARARALAAPGLEAAPGEDVELVIEGGTADVDDGGEPLLGSYVPPHPGDMTSPSRAPTVTLYYRTFLAMWREDGPYDWEAEVAETIEHELEHHGHHLRGEDPLDDEERAEIREEGLRLVGRREANRRAVSGFAASLADFATRTWPLFVLLALALAAMLLSRAESGE
jgi:hypothetical protein